MFLMSTVVYLHIPFCKSRCSYCDFATDVYRDSATVERYVAALRREVEVRITCGSGWLNAGIDTVYFGGGTPSLLTPKQLESILNAVTATFTIDPGAEITMEMNPATVTPETLREYRSLGVN